MEMSAEYKNSILLNISKLLFEKEEISYEEYREVRIKIENNQKERD